MEVNLPKRIGQCLMKFHMNRLDGRNTVFRSAKVFVFTFASAAGRRLLR
jgi:hypothetical protein